MRVFASLVVALLLLGSCAHSPAAVHGLRIDQHQFIGTHNAYHIEPDAALRMIWRSDLSLPEPIYDTLMYTHLPLSAQAELGIRFFELDLHLDALGGRYSTADYLAPILAAGLAPDAPFDADQDFLRPGTKVFHSVGDMRSTCLLLADCLGELLAWLEENPGQGPIIIQFEPKRLLDADLDGARSWPLLEEDILAVIPTSRIYRPRDLAAQPDQLRQAALAGRWPLLSNVSDQFIFILNGSARDTEAYVQALLQGQVELLFPALSDAASPFAAFVSRNDPFSEDITALSSRGQMIVTYADWRTYAARNHDTHGREAAFASGAQLIATDYPIPDRRLSNYSVRFREGFVRPRPILSEVVRLPED